MYTLNPAESSYRDGPVTIKNYDIVLHHVSTCVCAVAIMTHELI